MLLIRADRGTSYVPLILSMRSSEHSDWRSPDDCFVSIRGSKAECMWHILAVDIVCTGPGTATWHAGTFLLLVRGDCRLFKYLGRGLVAWEHCIL